VVIGVGAREHIGEHCNGGDFVVDETALRPRQRDPRGDRTTPTPTCRSQGADALSGRGPAISVVTLASGSARLIVAESRQSERLERLFETLDMDEPGASSPSFRALSQCANRDTAAQLPAVPRRRLDGAG
jgi:hypothetical protein